MEWYYAFKQHYGIERAGFSVKVLAAFDINPNCNKTYKLNFSIDPIRKSIQDLSLKYLDSFDSNCWLMSPPCQPYTRTGKKLDNLDPRAKGFLYLVSNLKNLTNPPRFIFLENVVGFELSKTRNIFCLELIRLGYRFKEFIISPTQLGIPNDRPRYYLTAMRFDSVDFDINQVPTAQVIVEWTHDLVYPIGLKKVKDYVDYDLLDDEFQKYKVAHQIIKNRNAFDKVVIAKPDDIRTSCFTKAYGQYGISSGGYVQTKISKKSIHFEDLVLLDPKLAVEELGLRFFTPEEIARIHCFPIGNGFQFPAELNINQRWKCLGNSMCVGVVAEIMRVGFNQKLYE